MQSGMTDMQSVDDVMGYDGPYIQNFLKPQNI